MGRTPPPNPGVYAPAYPPVAPAKSKAPLVIVILGVGCVGMVFVIGVLAAVMVPVFAQARERARTTTCLTNVKTLSTAALMYAQDYDEALPKGSVWMDKTSPYVIRMKTDGPRAPGQAFHCPSVTPRDADAYGYAFNSKVSGVSIGRVDHPDSLKMIYDSSNLQRNASDALTSLPSPPRHGGHRGNVFAYVDGHAKFVRSISVIDPGP